MLSENRRNLSNNSVVIYLKGRIETLEKRTRLDKNRPLLATKNPRDTIKEILKKRSHLYEETADFQIEVDEHSAEDIVNKIIDLLT